MDWPIAKLFVHVSRMGILAATKILRAAPAVQCAAAGTTAINAALRMFFMESPARGFRGNAEGSGTPIRRGLSAAWVVRFAAMEVFLRQVSSATTGIPPTETGAVRLVRTNLFADPVRVVFVCRIRKSQSCRSACIRSEIIFASRPPLRVSLAPSIRRRFVWTREQPLAQTASKIKAKQPWTAAGRIVRLALLIAGTAPATEQKLA